MKITLVRPSLTGGGSWDAMEPLALAILKGLTPPGVEVACVDDRLEAVPCEEPTDLVALTVETFTARRAYQIAAAYRRRGVPVVMGGYHPTLVPEEALTHAEAVVAGDAEGVWERVVDDTRRGRLGGVYRQQTPLPLAGPPPDRSAYAGKRYAPLTLHQYGRGCRFACDFCSIRAFYGTVQRRRPVGDLVAEIEAAGRRDVLFVDDNLFVGPEAARELFGALEPLGLRWACQASIDVARDPSLVERMAASGCHTVLLGFESLAPESLDQMRKGWNLRWQSYETAVRRLYDAGIMIYGTFVFGYDHDTPESFDAALEFAQRHHFELANFNPLTPTPGTPLYRRLEAEGRLLYERWWLDPAYRYGEATFRPRGMSPEALAEGCYRARTQFNRVGSMVRRLAGERHHWQSARRLGQFVLANLISRREIHAKQGVALGDPSLGHPTGQEPP